MEKEEEEQEKFNKISIRIMLKSFIWQNYDHIKQTIIYNYLINYYIEFYYNENNSIISNKIKINKFHY